MADKCSTRPRAANYEGLLHELTNTIAELQMLQEQAIETLNPAVQDMVRSGSRYVQRIEQTLDQLLDHACLPEGLALFKSLCRYYWQLDPQATTSYIHAYRAMCDSDDTNDIAKVKP